MPILGTDGKPYTRSSATMTHYRRMKKRVLSRYDAAQTTTQNAAHWGQADGQSPVASNSADIRLILARRSRYEADNNCYARGMINTLATTVIGTGPILQADTGDEGLDEFIEGEYSRWSRSINLPAKYRTMRKARCQDGEAFAILTTHPRPRHPVSLDIKLVETEQVADPTASLDGNDGIIYKDGYPDKYRILKNHPGDAISFTQDYTDYDADNVLHWFETNRPGQRRGIPEITAALPLFAQGRRFTLAVLAAAELVACMTLYLETQGMPSSLAEHEAAEIIKSDDTFIPQDIEPGMFTPLPDGSTMNQIKAEQPSTTYPQFKGELLNEEARCVGMPFNIMAGNSSTYNYASGRMDGQYWFMKVDVDRNDCEIVVCDRIVDAWTAEASRLPQYKQKNIPERINYRWMWPGKPPVDPLREAKATEILLSVGATNLAAVYAEQGKDWVTELTMAAKTIGVPLPRIQELLSRSLFAKTGDVGIDDFGDSNENKN